MPLQIFAAHLLHLLRLHLPHLLLLRIASELTEINSVSLRQILIAAPGIGLEEVIGSDKPLNSVVRR